MAGSGGKRARIPSSLCTRASRSAGELGMVLDIGGSKSVFPDGERIWLPLVLEGSAEEPDAVLCDTA